MFFLFGLKIAIVILGENSIFLHELHQRIQRYVVEGIVFMLSCAGAAVMKICCSIVWIVTGNYDIHCSQILSCGDQNVIEFSCDLTCLAL
jgi:hypothetical protein